MTSNCPELRLTCPLRPSSAVNLVWQGYLSQSPSLLAPEHLAGAVLLLAILGGYQNRKHEPPPGNQIMWRGYERISSATLSYRIAERRRRGVGVVQNE